MCNVIIPSLTERWRQKRNCSTSVFMLRIGITHRAGTNYRTETLSHFYRDPKRRKGSWLNSIALGGEIMQI